MLSVHTSPLDQPGSGDAGGMNVYIVQLAREIAAAGVEVEIFTRATSSELPPVAPAAPGVTVHHVPAGPYEPLPKSHLPAQMCALTTGVLRAEAARQPGWYDVVHSHYWLSGQVGRVVADRWGVPLVHSMHTMAKIKNRALAAGDRPEPPPRERGEEQIVRAAHRLIANTDDEAVQLVRLYGATPERVETVWPGVDLTLFTPGLRAAARRRLGLDPAAAVLLFAGRIQPLKAPDILVRTAARLVAAEPTLRRRLVVPIVGGLSGTGTEHPDSVIRLAESLDVADIVRLHPPVPQATLADWYRASDLTVVPSYNESFGLVALESQACGTPVVASAIGGLRTAVHDGHSGVLVTGHDPARWAHAIGALLDDQPRLDQLRTGALRHAAQFGWAATAARTLEIYTDTRDRHRAELLEAVRCS
ncbi:D-inositol-3-phosphate glycosyltransferase [Phytoactinopolyspora limicola]|uniref:D-inositol-3-phosphate glycosyltransferase n=1 Tax=Phytoactinopolyspora limicola TaxID=2715536 RepID=UPI00140CA349